MPTNNDITLPYQLQEGQVAYAGQVMANFNAIINKLNDIVIDGNSGNIVEVIEKLANSKVTKSINGNSNEIKFEDAESLQQKFNNGVLMIGAMTGQGMFYFNVDETGNLYVTTNGNISDTDFTIDADGNLIYTIKDLTAGESPVRRFSIGNVKGDKGDKGDNGDGDMKAAIYSPSKSINLEHKHTQILLKLANWQNGTYTVTSADYAEGDTFSFNVQTDFFFQPHYGDETKWQEWQKANIICISQNKDGFVLKALGTALEHDFYVDVSYYYY